MPFRIVVGEQDQAFDLSRNGELMKPLSAHTCPGLDADKSGEGRRGLEALA